ncbi:MAG: ankyrin repeat domain-containing protein [Alphaproteobacteria bacterium]
MAEDQFDPTAELLAEIGRDFEKPCDTEKVRALVKAGARLDATDERGSTPLILCSKMKKGVATLQILIDAGSPLETKNNEGLTALAHAAWHGREDIALALIAAHADVDAKDKDGNTPLTNALCCKHKKIIMALIEAGADVDTRFVDGASPLILAVIKESLHDIAEILLKKGCDLDTVREAHGFRDTALGLADEMGSPFAARIRQEISIRAEAAERRRLEMIEQNKEMLQGLADDMHAGAQKPVTVMTLRLSAERKACFTNA